MVSRQAYCCQGFLHEEFLQNYDSKCYKSDFLRMNVFHDRFALNV